MAHKGLFIMAGECFREGNPLSRTIDTNFGLETQIVASESHRNLIYKLQSLGWEIDTVINTRETNYKDLLFDFYDKVIYQNFTTHRPFDKCGSVFTHAILDSASNVDFDKYEFIFVCRLDTLLKDDLIKLFNPEWTKITYPNVMSINSDGTCISDLFVFIPKKYIEPFRDWNGLLANASIILEHHSVDFLVERGLQLSDMRFVTDHIYVANTLQQRNPLYAIVCRPEGPEHYKGFSNKRYISETHSVVDDMF